ncbi:MAG: CBS domain-containing protein [Gemmatimonadetes bacterium]|nr:MAG: CBS domain-containing protein [Gemmatimonadota bacterium]PYO78818.1 MAG: CBS domain-containing protein [Gemmatimonadota bacterium]
MRARDIMTKDPECLRREDTARRAAEVMRDKDCGVVPVIDDARRVIGIVTDRDLAVRVISYGKTPDTRLGDVMTPSVRSCAADDDLRDVERKMAELQVRRIPIVDAGGRCLGIISQADIARAAGRDSSVSEEEIALVLEQISEPAHPPRPRANGGQSEAEAMQPQF